MRSNDHVSPNTLYTLELTTENPVTRGAASLEDRLPTPSKDGVSNRKLASYRSFVEKEMLKIKTKAQDDGIYLKAPNGEDSRLTEKQWLQVRTKAFKEWFSDWENDTENTSKMMDETGETFSLLAWIKSFPDLRNKLSQL